MAKTREELLKEIQARMDKREGGSRYTPDPFEFKPPKVKDGEERRIKFVVLPPLEKGDPTAEGDATFNMGGLFYYKGGTHWINNRPYECPRMHDEDDCPVCSLGFELMNEVDDKAMKSELAKLYLPKQFWAVNIYFPEWDSNPAELRGKVMWMRMTQVTIFSKMRECLNRSEDGAKGDTPDEDKAFGFFYLPDESFVFNLVITHKGGYNSYELSDFLASTRGPILRNEDDSINEEAINALLAKRHNLPAKFSDRDVTKLSEAAQSIVEEKNGGSTSRSASSGFDETEKTTTTTTVTPTPRAATPAAAPEPVEPKSTTPAAAPEPTEPKQDPELESLLRQLADS